MLGKGWVDRVPSVTSINVRGVVSGATFTGYADELSKSYAFLAEQISSHLPTTAWISRA